MKHMPYKRSPLLLYQEPAKTLWIQPPLPLFLSTLPMLITIKGQGSGRQGPPPLAPAEEPAND